MVVLNVLVFFCFFLYLVSIYIRFYDDLYFFVEKKFLVMVVERIRIKKLLVEVIKDLIFE